MKKALFAFLISITMAGCGTNQVDDKNKKEVDADLGGSSVPGGDKRLNINILWDLSDRISDSLNPISPSHSERDFEIIRFFTSLFKADMKKQGAYKAKSKIRVFFTPPPPNNEINDIAKNLSVDLASFIGPEAKRSKKAIYDTIVGKFDSNAREIYRLTLQSNRKGVWDGSDIWRFFKNDVRDYCIEDPLIYRNILVILTDGYIYHKDSKEKQGNRTSYILPDMLKPFRNKPGWRSAFDKGDYGLISTRKDLQNLEVLVLELTPSKRHMDDEDILKAYLNKWFMEMGVPADRIACYGTDLPEYTAKRIVQFMGK